MSDASSTDAGAYLIGALRGAEREAFESHLRGCAGCRAEIEGLEHLPALLALVPREGAVDPPPSLLQGLLAEVRRKEARRRARLAGAGIAVAAVVGVVAWGELPMHWSEQEVASGVTVELSAVVQTPVTATANLVAVPWGTRVDLACGYPADQYAQPVEYALVVHDDRGRSEQIASWTALPGADANVPGATSMPLDRITRIEMTSRGAVVLVAEL
jgi:hypothetical protein